MWVLITDDPERLDLYNYDASITYACDVWMFETSDGVLHTKNEVIARAGYTETGKINGSAFSEKYEAMLRNETQMKDEVN